MTHGWSPGLERDVVRVGPAHEAVRQLVGRWPFRRGTQRIPAQLARAFKGLNSSGVVAGVGAGTVVFPYQPGDVAHPGYWFLYEKGVRKAIGRLLAPGSIFIDIGAHRGWHAAYALALVSPGGGVVACEPHPDHAKHLRILASLNPGKQFHVREVAIADFSGETTLFTAEQEGWHTIMPDFGEVSDVPRTGIAVSAVTLDDLLADYPDLALDDPPRRVVIKIDVEGAELLALNGAKRTLKRRALRALIVEISGGTGAWRERAIACVRTLRDAGWVPFVLRDRGIRPWRGEDACAQVNVLAQRDGGPVGTDPLASGVASP